MAANSQHPNAQDDVLSSLNGAIGALNLAEVSSITPVKAVLGSTGVLLTEIKVGSFQCMLVDCQLMYTGLDDQRRRLCRTRSDLR